MSRRVGEELNIVMKIVRIKIRASEADTYVKVGWLPGWRRRRKRKRETGQQQ